MLAQPRSFCVFLGGQNSRHFLLRPLEVFPHRLGVLEALGKSRLCPRKTCLCLGLQLEDLAVLCVQTARAKVNPVSKESRTQPFEGNSHLGLLDRQAIERDRRERICKSILHVLVEIDAARRSRALVVSLAASSVGRSGNRISGVTHARSRSHRRVGFLRRRDRVVAVIAVVVGRIRGVLSLS